MGLRPERKREGERRVAVTLGELARKERAPVCAAHVRNVFLEEVFLDHVGEHVEKASRGAGHVSGVFGDAFLAHVENAFLVQLALCPQISGDSLGSEVTETFARHGLYTLILLMTS